MMQRNKTVKVILVYFNPNLIDHSAALRDLVPFIQFKKREKHPWRSVTFSKVAGWLILEQNASDIFMNSSPCHCTYCVPLFYIYDYCCVQATALLKVNENP